MSQERNKCRNCNGSGKIKCSSCGGAGYFIKRDYSYLWIFGYELIRSVNCYKCNGTGKEDCTYCNGTGKQR